MSVITGVSRFSRQSFRESLSVNRPNFTAFLPQGAILGSAAATISDAPFPAYFISYTLSGKSRIGYVAFDKFYGRYRLRAVVTLETPNGPFRDVAEISTAQIGSNSTLVLVRGSSDVRYEQTVAVLVRQDDSLATASMRNRRGDNIPPFFYERETTKSEETISAVDITGDGSADIIDTKKPSAITDVYRWSGSQFVYDQNLSTGFEMDRAVFPAPSAPIKK